MGEGLPESMYRELLKHTREAIKVVKGLMRSEDEEIQVYAVDAFMNLSNLAVALAEALGDEPEPKEERNPLARRFKVEEVG